MTNNRLLVCYSPCEATQKLIKAICDVGAGAHGHYTQCAWVSQGVGQYQCSEHSSPYQGEAGEPCQVVEDKIEIVVPETKQSQVKKVILAQHPYEHPVFFFLPLCDDRGASG